MLTCWSARLTAITLMMLCCYQQTVVKQDLEMIIRGMLYTLGEKEDGRFVSDFTGKKIWNKSNTCDFVEPLNKEKQMTFMCFLSLSSWLKVPKLITLSHNFSNKTWFYTKLLYWHHGCDWHTLKCKEWTPHT